jgi:hypothetical protein
VLILVQIEKPQPKLVTKDGALRSEFQKGRKQIYDWSVVVSDHRVAFLNELGLKNEEVHDMRFLLVAGLARQTSSEALIILRRNPPGLNTQFLCFDELAGYLLLLGGHLDMM